MLSRLYRRLPSGFINYQNFKIMRRDTNHFRPGMIAFYVLSVFLISGIISCNPKENDSQTSQTAKNDSTPPPPTAKQFLGNGNFAYLAIAKDSLDKFFILTPPQGGLKAKKIVFRFSHDGMEGTNIVIDGFLTKSGNVNYLDRPPVFLLPALANASTDLSGQKIYLSDLEMTSTQYMRFINNSVPKKYLILIPYIIGNNPPNQEHCVNYWMFWLDSIGALVSLPPQNLGADNTLNPSPPADPGP